MKFKNQENKKKMLQTFWNIRWMKKREKNKDKGIHKEQATFIYDIYNDQLKKWWDVGKWFHG